MVDTGCTPPVLVEMSGVREYAEGYPVRLCAMDNARLAIEARNQGGYDCTHVDLCDLLKWLQDNRPELLEGM